MVHMCGFSEEPGKEMEVASVDVFVWGDLIAWKSSFVFAVGKSKYLKHLANMCMGKFAYLYLWQTNTLYKDHLQNVKKRYSKKVLPVLGISLKK